MVLTAPAGRWMVMEVIVVLALVGVVGGLAAAFGADSRDGNDWAWHSRV